MANAQVHDVRLVAPPFPAAGNATQTLRPGAVARAADPHLAYSLAKRTLDIAASIVLIVALLPMLALVTLLVFVTSGWPVFFGQRRIGLEGREFTCWKFRTMIRDAESRRDEVLHLNLTGGPTFKAASDPRVSWLGRFLRTTSLDELPQLWNVLRGDMSLVGPRPLPTYENRYVGDQVLRLSVKPGITCIWQVSGRSTIGFEEWMRLDLNYVRTRSLAGDIVLLFRTIGALLRRDGAV